MPTYLTSITAIDPKDGKLKTFAGNSVIASTWEDAEDYLRLNEMGYCKVIGELKRDESIKVQWN